MPNLAVRAEQAVLGALLTDHTLIAQVPYLAGSDFSDATHKWIFDAIAREPPAGGRANAAVTRAVARWAGVAPSQVAIVSGATARRKLVEIQREDAFPPPDV
jgi:replicative DNA helicase